MGEGCRVAKEAVVRGPVVLGPGCSVGEGAAVENAVLWEGVEVGRGARVSRAVLGNGTKIGEGVGIADTALVGHMARVTIVDV
jgi:NDP-sugar pyrophosphorylase family protein